MVDAAMWRPPPFRQASRLVQLYTTFSSPVAPLARVRWSYPRLRWLRERVTSAKISSVSQVALTLSTDDTAYPINGEVVSPEYFGVLDVAPVRGRGFLPNEDSSAGAHPVVVISHELWRHTLDERRDIVGSALRLNGQRLTVIGVMPEGFRGISDAASFWVPATMAPLLSYREYLTTSQNFIGGIARLAPNTSLARFESELGVLNGELQRLFPPDDTDSLTTTAIAASTINAARTTPLMRRGLWTLLGALALLHLLSCANAANLALGRALTRRRELAVRLAIGARPRALIATAVAEGTLLVATGSGVGLWLAWGTSALGLPVDLLLMDSRRSVIGAFATYTFGARAALGALVVFAATLPLVALLPATLSLPRALPAALRDAGDSGKAAAPRRVGPRTALIAVEAVFAMVLLALAGLFAESYRRIRAEQLGVDASRVLTFELQPSEVDVPPVRAPVFIDAVLEAIAAVPGVVSASVDGGAPTSGSASALLHIVGRPEATAPPLVLRHYVGPQHLTTLGMTLKRGRMFTAADRAGQPPVAVISETAANRYWPQTDPIGERVWFDGSAFTSPDSSAEVIGVVSDVRYDGFDGPENGASVYTPYAQFTYAWRVYFVRTIADPTAVVPSIAAAIRRVNPDVPMKSVRPLGALMGQSWRRQGVGASAFSAFAVIALGLAAVGIGAVVAHAVTNRQRELAIRAAVGSSPARLFRLVCAQGMVAPTVGLTVGIGICLALGRVLGAVLYEVRPRDPWVLLSTAILLLFTVALACAVPALRAMRSDPIEALRSS